MTTIAWFHAFNGIAGDMALGACLDAGAPLAEVRRGLDALGVQGWGLRSEPTLRGGLAATRALVEVADSGAHRPAAEVLDLVGSADLPDRARDRALAVFRRLAEVEGRLHRTPPEEVHLHEVGALDSIVDVVGTCLALELLGVDQIHAGPVATGVGTVRAAHGVLPVPTPAVVELLKGCPTRRVDVPHELTTPTGAAILATLTTSWGPMPAMSITAAGYGAGSREIDGRVNATQLVVGLLTVPMAGTDQGQPMVEVAVNVDDVTGEVLGHLVTQLLDAGAADAWITPVVMKKGRPGHVVTALSQQEHVGAVAETLTTETGSLGVRARQVERWPAARSFESVDVDGLAVRIKVTEGRTKVEHDDAADVARRTGRPLREVVSLAEEAARRRRPAAGGDDDPEPA